MVLHYYSATLLHYYAQAMLVKVLELQLDVKFQNVVKVAGKISTKCESSYSVIIEILFKPVKILLLGSEISQKISLNLRTVPTIVIAHTFCASRHTRISYR